MMQPDSDAPYRELLLGCGHARDKRIRCPSNMAEGWRGLVTLDHNIGTKPDIWTDLDKYDAQGRLIISGDGPCVEGRRIETSSFDEVHAYEVLEHLGSLGDYLALFTLFSELWRILKPGGYLAGTVPSRYSSWLWGDPGHRRAILPETLMFLAQPSYFQCDGPRPSPISDYRGVYKADFDRIRSEDDRVSHRFLLQAVKPARTAP